MNPLHTTIDHVSPSGRVGIVDIGSNSIRLVVYDQLKRAPVPLYNEKVMCQLGKGLASSGKLNPEGAIMARQAVKRYLALARNMEVTSVHVMATAAVRDATDGRAFAESLTREHGMEVDIISGEKEARLGAYGICSSVHEPSGITGDLGGGSMELVRLEHGELGEHTTLPIGPLRLIDETKGSKSELKKVINKAFDSANWVSGAKPQAFYAIGGSLRAIARLHMDRANYPLRILHQYTVSAKQFAPFLDELLAMSEDRLEKLPGLSGKRAPAIPPAALILQSIIERMQPTQLVFSASGIREGYLFEKLPPYLRSQDALIASCMEIAGKTSIIAYAHELMVWMQPLLDRKETPSERRLRLAFCLLSDIAHHLHPEYRADWAFQRILYSSLTSLTHEERIQLGLALFHRHQYKVRDNNGILKLLTDRQRHWARLVGTGANLAYHLSGSIAGNLHQTPLGLDKKHVAVAFVRGSEDLMGDAIAKRISGVDEAYQKWIGE